MTCEQGLRRSRFVGWACAALAIAVASSAVGQPPSRTVFTGKFAVGVRGVDVSGSDSKYREDVDHDDGARLVDLAFTFVPDEDESKVDRVDVRIDNLGGEPFESTHVGVRKYGVYNLQIDRRKSRYFYNDTLTPIELASIEASTAGDFHSFDFERVRDTARLDINLSPATKLRMNLEQYTRIGDSVTTLDIQRDEFELEKPIDESSRSVGFGIQHAWEQLTLVFEERVDDFDSSSEVLLPGFSQGANASDLATLAFFRFGQPYDFSSRTHSLSALATPADRLRINASWQAGDLDLDMYADEQSNGTTFLGEPFSTSLTGNAQVERDSHIFDVELALRAHDRVHLLFGVKDSELMQIGQSALGVEEAATRWSVETSELELGIEVAIGASVVVAAGLSTEERDVAVRSEVADSLGRRVWSTERDGYFARLTYKPIGSLSVTASVEENSIDDPYSLSAPTNARRLRIGARYQWTVGVGIAASFRKYDLDNDLSQWRGDTEQMDIRVNGTHDAVQWSAGVGTVEYSRSIDQLVTGGFRQDLFVIDYLSNSDFVDGSVRWQASDRVSVGASAAAYDSDGTHRLNRDDWRTYVEFIAGNDYVVGLSLRDIDYSEDRFDDYDAKIVEASIGLRW